MSFKLIGGGEEHKNRVLLNTILNNSVKISIYCFDYYINTALNSMKVI